MTKNLGEHSDKLDAATKEEIQKVIDEAKKLDPNSDVEALKAQTQALSNAAMKIGQAMYQNKGSSGGSQADNTTDAETVDHDDKKK